jgi:hypothetical protein
MSVSRSPMAWRRSQRENLLRMPKSGKLFSMEIIWTPKGLESLRGIQKYIAQGSPVHAKKMYVFRMIHGEQNFHEIDITIDL